MERFFTAKRLNIKKLRHYRPVAAAHGSLIMPPCFICPLLFLIFQPVSGLKVDSNLGFFFVSLVGMDIFLYPGIL